MNINQMFELHARLCPSLNKKKQKRKKRKNEKRK